MQEPMTTDCLLALIKVLRNQSTGCGPRIARMEARQRADELQAEVNRRVREALCAMVQP